jgi:hypothetical protein
VELALLLRSLWRLRALAAVAAVICLTLGFLAAFHPQFPPKSRQYTVGTASARALVDTPSSQIVDLRSKTDADAAVLPSRAILLANLLASTPFRDETAKRSGIPADRLIALADTPTDSGVKIENPPSTGASLAPGDPRANVLTAHTDVSLPLITVNVRAPTPAGAARLADSALAVLETQLAALADSQGVPRDKRLIVKRLGTARAGAERQGPSPLFGLLVALGAFLVAACAIIAVVAGLRRVIAAERYEIIDAAAERQPAGAHAAPGLDATAVARITRKDAA